MSTLIPQASPRVRKTTGASETIYIGGLYEVTGGVATKHIFAGGRRIASKTGTSVYYYHPDHLGSLNVATNNAGNSVQNVTYYPFGEVRTNTGTVDLAYKFTGQELDTETGLYYYGARYYDPALGRFTSGDSIVQSPGDPQTLNRYAYARNNPLLYVDPSGHFFFELFIGALLGAAFGATMSAITGHDPGKGALMGTISGIGFAGAHFLTEGMTDICEAAMVHAGMGAATGAINAAISGGNAGFGALTGGVSGGIAGAMGGVLPDGFGQQLGGRMLTGAVAGGFTAAIVGGDFKQGMFNGAWTAGFGYLFNESLTVMVRTANGLVPRTTDTETGKTSYGLPGSSYRDPLTEFSKEHIIPAYLKALSVTIGLATSLESGSAKAGEFAFSLSDEAFNWLQGKPYEIPIPYSPVGIPASPEPLF